MDRSAVPDSGSVARGRRTAIARGAAVLIIAGCVGDRGETRPEAPDSVAAAPVTSTAEPSAALPPGVVLRDRQPYQSEIASGTLAVLYVDGELVDSVDMAFGVHAVGHDSLLFLPVNAYELEGRRGGAEVGGHVLATSAGRVELEPRLPYFDSYFSSPVVIGDAIIYWGLRNVRSDGGVYDLYAIRHDLGTGRTDSLRLDRVGLYTDFRFHLPPPVVGDTGVRFVGDSAVYLVAPDFSAVERRARESRR